MASATGDLAPGPPSVFMIPMIWARSLGSGLLCRMGRAGRLFMGVGSRRSDFFHELHAWFVHGKVGGQVYFLVVYREREREPEKKRNWVMEEGWNVEKQSQQLSK